MTKLKILVKIIYWAILVFLIFVAGFTALTAFNLPGNHKMFVVMSGSMEPTIKTGSIVVVQPVSHYQTGDIITFGDPTRPRDTVTHRIYKIQEATASAVFVTKGDANKTADFSEVPVSRVLGKTIFALPYLGFVVSFAKTQQGLLLLVIIPAVIIIYSEILTIKTEALRLIRERRRRKLTPVEEVEEKIGEEIIAAEKEIKKKKK